MINSFKEDDNGLYRYMSAERSIQVLSDETVRFNSPLLFNDPFDVIRDINNIIDKDNLYSDYVSYFRHHYINKPDRLSHLHRAWQCLAKIIQSSDNSTNEDKIFQSTIVPAIDRLFSDANTTWSNSIRRLRILCFSSQIDNVPLWYHYADKYKGAAISFVQDKELFINDDQMKIDCSSLRAIEYEVKENLKAIKQDTWFEFFCYKNDDFRDTDDNMLFNLCLEKYIDWSYEKEKRIISVLGKEYYDGKLYNDIKLSPEAIDQVFLGPEIGVHNKNQIIALVKHKYPKAKIYQTKIKSFLEFEKL